MSPFVWASSIFLILLVFQTLLMWWPNHLYIRFSLSLTFFSMTHHHTIFYFFFFFSENVSKAILLKTANSYFSNTDQWYCLLGVGTIELWGGDYIQMLVFFIHCLNSFFFFFFGAFCFDVFDLCNKALLLSYFWESGAIAY